ncbi:MAG: tetratricopeptide repeat protein, partial [Anaerolineae bacterium]|nr:tetratricopeptide repeat protein [Anaerolineae bacterium]
AEARISEIMGREVAPSREAEAPQELAPAEIPEWLREAAPPEAPAREAAPSWLEEGRMPEGEEALAWLASLAAGREAELRAAAQAEAEARISEIMGREVAPSREVEAPQELAPAEIPEWLREAAPPEAPVPEVAVQEEEALLEWLRETPMPEIPEGEEVLSEWLEGTPPPEEAEEEVILESAGAMMPPEVPRAAVPPAEPEIFGWTAFGAEEEILQPPLPGEEISPPGEPFGWTAFGEEVMAPEVPSRIPTGVEEAEMPMVPPEGAPEVAPPTIVPPEGITPPVAPVWMEAPPSEEVRVSVDALRAHVRAHPRDYEARLNLARALRQAGFHAEALEAYSRLLRAGKLMDKVVADMEDYAASRPKDPAVRRVLGDAYMRAERLAEALATYREALELLE